MDYKRQESGQKPTERGTYSLVGAVYARKGAGDTVDDGRHLNPVNTGRNPQGIARERRIARDQ